MARTKYTAPKPTISVHGLKIKDITTNKRKRKILHRLANNDPTLKTLHLWYADDNEFVVTDNEMYTPTCACDYEALGERMDE